MAGTVGYRLIGQGRAALLTLTNPPVNGLAHGVRAGVIAGLETARNDGVEAVLLVGAGRTFPAGADVSLYRQ